MLDLNDAVARQGEKAGADRTHTSPAGAQLTVLTVLEGLRGLPGGPLAAFFGTTFSGAAWSTDINGPHLGAWVDTPAGEDWFFHFQDLDAYGRVVDLQPMRWRDDGWPVMGVDTDGGGLRGLVLVSPGTRAEIATAGPHARRHHLRRCASCF